MDIPVPWTFQLRNPRNPGVNKTHAGVLEFIAEEGIVHLPAWVSGRSIGSRGYTTRIRRGGSVVEKGRN